MIDCAQQWLRTANTCPVCREKVKASPKPAPARRRPYRDLSSRDFTAPSETNHGASSSTSGNRPSHPTPQTNNVRPPSFAAVVFDRLMNDGRDGNADAWTSSSPPVPPPTRDGRNVYLERLRAGQQQQQHSREAHQAPHTHDYQPAPHEVPYHLRVPPTSQAGSSTTRTTTGTDGPGARPYGFVSLLRGQGSDSSMSTSSSTSMAVDDVGAPSGRRLMVGTSGSSGSMFPDAPTMQRREGVFSYVPPSSGAFVGTGGPSAPLPLPQQQQSSFDAHGMNASATEAWRAAWGYDALFNVETSRSSSSSSSSASVSPSRPMSVANRIPVEEDSSFEDYMFGWGLRGGRLYPFEEEPTRRRSGEGASSGQ